MRIVHYLHATRLDLGGPVRAALDLCSGFANAGHEVTLLTTDDQDAPEEWSNQGNPKVVRLPNVPSLKGFGRRDAIGLVNEHLARADILHLHGTWRPDNVPVAAAARRLGCPYVFSPHGTIDDWSMSTRRPRKRLYLLMYGRRMLEGAAAVHCTAREELKQARKWFPRGRGEVIPLLIDLEPFRTATDATAAAGHPGDANPARSGSPFRILFLSLLNPVKGVELLLEATRNLKDRGVECELVVAGSGDPRYVAGLERMVADLGIADRVRFLGFVSGEDKVVAYRSADVFCLPSEHENFGLVWAEALAAGTPVVTTKGVGVWSDLQEGGGTKIVDRTAAAFGDAIAELVADPAQARAMGERGCDWVFSFLDPKRIIGRFETLYAEAAAVTTGAAARSVS